MAKFRRFDPRNKKAGRKKTISKNGFSKKIHNVDRDEYVYTQRDRSRVQRPRSDNNERWA